MTTMHTGSSRLAMTRVFSLGLFLCLAFSCGKGSPNRHGKDANDTLSSNEKKNFKPFLGSKVHLEVAVPGQTPQVFYFVDPKDLISGFALKKNVQVQGTSYGMEEYLFRDQAASTNEGVTHFSDIIALPVVNKTSLVSPRIPTAQSQLASDQTFKLDLTAGLSYDLILNPGGLYDRAPVYASVGPLEWDGAVQFAFDPQSVKLSGEIHADGSPICRKRTPQCMLKAKIMQGNRLVSSVGMLDEHSHFNLEITGKNNLSATTPLTLVVETLSPNAGFPIIKRNLDSAKIYGAPNLGAIDIGTLANQFGLTINVVNDEKKPISQGNVYLNADIGVGESSIKRGIDAQGSVILDELYAGTYDIAVVMPSDSPFGMRMIKDVDLSPKNQDPINLFVPRRKALDASIVDNEGQHIEDAHVELSRIGEIGAFATEDIFEDLLFKNTLTTNGEGRVCNKGFNKELAHSNCSSPPLDEGRYLAHIIPPEGSQLSHTYVTFDFPSPKALEFRLDEPEMLSGKIVAADQSSPIKKAHITIYAAQTDLYNQPRVIANAITNDDGIFMTLVPRATKAAQTGGY